MSRLIVAAVGLALLGAGCGERSEPLGELSQTYPVTVQGAGEGPAVLTGPPQRIVALDPGSAELLIALGVAERLVGAPAGVRGAENARAVVQRNGQVDVDAAVALEPDLIVATPTIDLVDVALAARESGATVYVQPASSVEDVQRGAVELGFLVDRPLQARTLVARIRAAVEQVESRLADAPIVTTFVDTGFFTTIAGRSLLGDLIRRAHGENVAGETPAPEPFDLARLRRLDPDVYLATSDSKVTLKALRADRRTADLRAVRRGNFAVLPADLVLRAGPRVGRALRVVAGALHPDATG